MSGPGLDHARPPDSDRPPALATLPGVKEATSSGSRATLNRSAEARQGEAIALSESAVMLDRWSPRALLAWSVLVAACSEQPTASPSAAPSAKPTPSATPTPTPSARPACSAHSGPVSHPPPRPFVAIVADPNASAPAQLALAACVGLQNRKSPASAYVEADPHDAVWLTELNLTPHATVSASTFLSACVATFPTCVRYDYTSQQTLMPNILTVAAALGAVPLDQSLNLACGTVAFDAVQELQDKSTPALATQYVFDNYIKQTTGLAMLNPGYEQPAPDPSNPPMTADMQPSLVDFVFSQKLFVVYLNNGCVDGNPENEVLSSIVNSGQWATPLGVYGYNGSWNVEGGDLYEAQTAAWIPQLGAIASRRESLLLLHARGSDYRIEHRHAERARVDFLRSWHDVRRVHRGGRRQHRVPDDHAARLVSRAVDRLPVCRRRVRAAHVEHLAAPRRARTRPARLVLRAEPPDREGLFRAAAQRPPVRLPVVAGGGDQDRFVAETQEDACILDVTGTVHWDWFGTWHVAEDHFLPKYGTAGGSVRGVFPVNVPYSFPTFTWWPDNQFFEVLKGADGSKLALFRPREWRGVTDDTDPTLLSPQVMASGIGGYPKGTITGIYMTSDGGLTLENAFTPSPRFSLRTSSS